MSQCCTISNLFFCFVTIIIIIVVVVVVACAQMVHVHDSIHVEIVGTQAVTIVVRTAVISGWIQTALWCWW